MGVSQPPSASLEDVLLQREIPAERLHDVELGLGQGQRFAAPGRSENLLLGPVGGVAAVHLGAGRIVLVVVRKGGRAFGWVVLVGQRRAAVVGEVSLVSVPAVGVVRIARRIVAEQIHYAPIAAAAAAQPTDTAHAALGQFVGEPVDDILAEVPAIGGVQRDGKVRGPCGLAQPQYPCVSIGNVPLCAPSRGIRAGQNVVRRKLQQRSLQCRVIRQDTMGTVAERIRTPAGLLASLNVTTILSLLVNRLSSWSSAATMQASKAAVQFEVVSIVEDKPAAWRAHDRRRAARRPRRPARRRRGARRRS